MSRYRIVLADDHSLIREGIKRILEVDPGLEVMGEASDGIELLELLKTCEPDLIILDISMPNLDGLEALEKIKTNYPAIKVLILTIHKLKEYMSATFAARADGYLLKEDVYGDLLAAIGEIRKGGKYVSRLMTNQVVELLRRRPGQLLLDEVLNSKEKALLRLFSQGKTTKQIAEDLSIAIASVHNYLFKIRKKLDISTNIGLLDYAIKRQISRPDFN